MSDNKVNSSIDEAYDLGVHIDRNDNVYEKCMDKPLNLEDVMSFVIKANN